MRLGCCGNPDDAKKYADAGFDFVEVNVQSVLKATESDAAWSASAPDVTRLALPIEAANCLVPGNLPIVGPQRDLAALTGYMKNVTARAKKLGMQRLVFGSGGARKRPEGVDERTAMDHLVEFTRMAADASGKHGVVLVIEHLNKGETNTINSLTQELELIERVNHPACAALVDSYHFGLENETDDTLLALGDRIKHVHVAEVKDRLQPGGHGPGSRDAFDFDSFFCLLHKLGYDERVSIECKWGKPFDEAGAATAKLLRAAWSEASRCAVTS